MGLALVGWALKGPPGPLWTILAWARPHGRALVGPMGRALMGQALMGRALVGQALMGWALMGQALMGWAFMVRAPPEPCMAMPIYVFGRITSNQDC